MNIFRLAGDMTHLMSIVVLLLKIRATKSCRGISLRTQEMYLLVFLCRYLDLFYSFVSLYNTVMKLIFLASSAAIVYYMRYDRVVKQTYDRRQDTFRYLFLIVPCLILALLINHAFTLTEILWTFSIYLEAVAILPQLVLMQRTQNIDNLTGNYVLLLGWGWMYGWSGKWRASSGSPKGCCVLDGVTAFGTRLISLLVLRRLAIGCSRHIPLPFCAQDIPGPVHPQLDLPLLHRTTLPSVAGMDKRAAANGAVW
ncbi:ERD2A [Auxenochlorella protothecoides x Auxenochlorella symbiontica]